MQNQKCKNKKFVKPWKKVNFTKIFVEAIDPLKKLNSKSYCLAIRVKQSVGKRFFGAKNSQKSIKSGVHKNK